MFKKALYVAYGLICYLAFLVFFLNLILFSGNLFVPVTVDHGPETPAAIAVLVNLGLLTQFGISHSIMARKSFKAWWTQFVPVELERSTFVLVSSLSVGLIVWFWQPIDGIVWDLSNTPLNYLLWASFAAGWGLVLISSMLINHFDLFGLRQVYLYARDTPYTPVKFQVNSLYRIIRHPLQLGIVLGIWSYPTMTVGHLFYAMGFTVYILIGLYFEEQDLVRDFGKKYLNYRARTPQLIPFLSIKKQKNMVTNEMAES